MSDPRVNAIIRFDVSGFAKAIRKAAIAMERLGAAATGRPVRPLPRLMFDGTAREYRAARRQYAREVRAHRKAAK